MNAHQRHQHEQMRLCAELAASGAGHTPETRRDFNAALVRQAFRDDAARHSTDLFDRIESDNRPASH